MNVLLIAIDTLRADRLGTYGYQKNTSPFIDKFAKSAVVFENYFAPEIPTQPSYTSLYTGQYSITHNIVTHGGSRTLSDKTPVLPEILHQNDYTTCAIDNLLQMKPWFARGYEFYIVTSYNLPGFQFVSADMVNNRALEWLDNHHKEKFFMFIHYWDPHTPYLPPKRYRKLFYEGNPSDPKDRSMKEFFKTPHGQWFKNSWLKELGGNITDADYVAAMYDSEIRYTDDAVKKVVNKLKTLGILEDTVIIILSDHGEVLTEHPGFFDHHGLYEENIHVPLIIRFPNREYKKRVNQLVLTPDIAPTILEILGIETPNSMEGISFLPKITGEDTSETYDFFTTQECAWQAKWAIREWPYKLIVAMGPDLHNQPKEELYNLEKDPTEQRNIVKKAMSLRNRLKRKLENWRRMMLKKSGRKKDPLTVQKPPLAKLWTDWFKKHKYW